MKKLLSLLMSVLLIVTVIGTVSTVSAEEIDYTLVNESFVKSYWKEFTSVDNSKYDSGVVKVGDWYYRYGKNKETKKIGIAVCGYGGTETEIEIPNQLAEISINHINEFYLFSTTVKTVRIPKEIVYINTEIIDESMDALMEEEDRYYNYPPIIECVDGGQLEEIIVDSENLNYASKDGVLLTKNGKRLIYYPQYKTDEKYIVPDTVKYITKGAFAKAEKLKSLTITPNVTELGYNSIPKKGLEELRFENTLLPEYGYSVADPMPDSKSGPLYVPDVPNTVVYCIEGSELYEIYEQSFEEPVAMCKELKVLPLVETLKKEADGKWYYYWNNSKMMHSSTLVKYKGVWFYVKDGVWDKTVSDVLCSYKGKGFYIKNGKWDKSANGFIKIKSVWFYFKDGKRHDKSQDLVKYKGVWFYVIYGRWYEGKDGYAEILISDYPYSDGYHLEKFPCSNTLFKKNGKWFAIKSGKWYKGKAIISYSGKKFLVNKGFVQFDYSGKVKVDGKTYNIKNGKVA